MQPDGLGTGTFPAPFFSIFKADASSETHKKHHKKKIIKIMNQIMKTKSVNNKFSPETLSPQELFLCQTMTTLFL